MSQEYLSVLFICHFLLFLLLLLTAIYLGLKFFSKQNGRARQGRGLLFGFSLSAVGFSLLLLLGNLFPSFNGDFFDILKVSILAVALFFLLGFVYRFTNQDDTPKNTVEQTWAAGKNPFQSLTKNHNAPFLLVEPDSGKIVDANMGAAHFFGYACEELSGMYAHNIIDLPLEQLAGNRQKVVEQGGLHFVTPHHTKNGEVRSAEVYASPVNINGRTLIFSVIHDITTRNKAEEALHRSDQILHAVAYASEQFLVAENWQNVIADVLARLGKAAGASRVYIFENHFVQDTLVTSQRYEWTAAGISAQIDNPDLQSIQFEQAGFARWLEVLSKGGVIHGNIGDFPDSERPTLEVQGIRSIVVVPIFCQGQWWGFIGYDDCLSDSAWQQVEIEALHTAANTLGAAIQRQKSENARKQAEHRYHSLFEQSHDAILILSLEGKHIDANRRASELLGYTYEELLNISVRDTSAQPEHSESIRQALLRGEHIPLYERVFRRKDGSQVPVEINVELVRDINGEPLYIQSVVRDITERKKAEEALYQSRERYRIVADFTYDWEYWVDQDNNLLYISPSVERITGYTRDEFLEEPTLLYEIVHPDDLEIFKSHILSDSLTQKDKNREIEFRIITKRGETRWISHACTPAHLEDGRYAGRRAGNRDITERIQMQNKNALYSKMLENLNDVSTKLSLAPTFDEMCRIAVQLGHEKLGFDRLGLWFIDPTDPEYMIGSFGIDEQGNLRDERLVRIPTTPNDINTRLMKDRSFMHFKENVPVFDEQQNIVGRGDQAGVSLWDGNTVIGFLYVDNLISGQAIDERQRELLKLFSQAIGHQGSIKRSQEQLRQLNINLEERVNERTRQLEATITELESFSYSVSHNLRSPLRAINGYSNLIDRDLKLPPTSESKQLLERIKNNAQLMGQMMDELLAFIQLGRKSIQKSTVDPNTVVQDVLQELNPQGESAAINFTLATLPTCQADTVLLRQVYRNLIGNAIKYSRQRETAQIEIGWQTDEHGKNVYFVRDNGVGFDMRYYDKLFGVFHRLHHNHEFEGTGVGLAFANRIVSQHGGRMWAESRLNEGATFYFTLD